MNRQFKRILGLVKKTGDRVIVTDPDGDSAYVVMDLDQYEGLLGLGWDDDDDFGDWHGPHGGPNWSPEDDGELVEFDEEKPVAKSESIPDPIPEPPVEPENIRKAVEHDLAILESWQSEKQAAAAPEIPKKPEDDDKINPDEERFYLEPIE